MVLDPPNQLLKKRPKIVQNQYFSTKIDAIDAEKREESKNNIKNTKKHQKTPKNTKKHKKTPKPKHKIKTVKQKKLKKNKRKIYVNHKGDTGSRTWAGN